VPLYIAQCMTRDSYHKANLLNFNHDKNFMEKNQKPLILITNDDGITAPGIRMLIALYVKEYKNHSHDHKEYTTSGTPVDCVKMARHEILGRKPDLCLSGINHGSNSAINVIYSGTMSAAIEAGIEGIPAIGFSLCDYDHDADFDSARPYVKNIID